MRIISLVTLVAVAAAIDSLRSNRVSGADEDAASLGSEWRNKCYDRPGCGDGADFADKRCAILAEIIKGVVTAPKDGQKCREISVSDFATCKGVKKADMCLQTATAMYQDFKTQMYCTKIDAIFSKWTGDDSAKITKLGKLIKGPQMNVKGLPDKAWC